MEPSPPPSTPSPGQKLAAWCGRLRLPRSPWVYLLVAVALLAASEVLWRWHSWPAREILETEKLMWGPTA